MTPGSNHWITFDCCIKAAHIYPLVRRQLSPYSRNRSLKDDFKNIVTVGRFPDAKLLVSNGIPYRGTGSSYTLEIIYRTQQCKFNLEIKHEFSQLANPNFKWVIFSLSDSAVLFRNWGDCSLSCSLSYRHSCGHLLPGFLPCGIS